MGSMKEQGTRQLVWLSNDLFAIIEQVRKGLGMSKSAFYRYCIIKTLDSMSVLSTKAKQTMTDGG